MLPKEYSPELDAAMLEKLKRGTYQDEDRAVGLARSESQARGGEWGVGGALESSGVNAARTGGINARSDIDTNFAFNLAGLGREERLGKEARGYQVEDRTFNAGEAEKERSLREKLAILGYDSDRMNAKYAADAGLEGQVWGGLGTAVGMGLGGYLGRKR